MAKTPEHTPAIPTIESRLETERADLLKLRETLQMQLNIVVNELHLIERVLNPVAPIPVGAPADAESPAPLPPEPPGTI